MKWIAAASIVIALAASVFAFLRHQAADAAEGQVASLQGETQKAQADLKAARAERDALRKEAADLKLAAEQSRADADTAARFLEAEKANSAKLHEDLAMTRARLAAASARPPRASDPLPPGLVPFQRPPPVVVRAAPGGGSTAAGAASAGGAAGLTR